VLIGLTQLGHRQLYHEYDVHKKILVRLRLGGFFEELFYTVRALESHPDVRPSRLSLACLIDYFLKKDKNIIKAAFIFDKWQKRGILPLPRACAHLLDRLLKSGNEKKALEIQNVLASLTDWTDSGIYAVFINVYLKTGRAKLAAEMIAKQRAAGIPPNKADIAMVAQELVRNSQVESAFKMLKNIPDSLALNTYSYTNVLAALVRNDEQTKFHELYTLMVSRNVHPNWVMHSALMYAYMSRRNYPAAEDFWKRLLEHGRLPNLGPYSIALRLYSGMRNYEECDKLFEIVLRQIKAGVEIQQESIASVTRYLAERHEESTRRGGGEDQEGANGEGSGFSITRELRRLVTHLNDKKIKIPAYTHSALATYILRDQKENEFDDALGHLQLAEQDMALTSPRNLVELDEAAKERILSKLEEEVPPHLI